MNKEETVKNLLEKTKYDFEDLLLIMKVLRMEGGCAWDREQTHQSLRACMIEEAYEVVEAIDQKDEALLREELGDVLFQVVFHTQIEYERDAFSMDDVLQGICEKMIRRHPHVFAEETAEDANAVIEKWELIKAKEKQRKTKSAGLRSIPSVLPALMRAEKTSSKIGFSESETVASLTEQIEKQAKQMNGQDEALLAETLGGLLYKCASLAAFCGLDAEQLLGQAVEKAILKVENEEKSKK